MTQLYQPVFNWLNNHTLFLSKLFSINTSNLHHVDSTADKLNWIVLQVESPHSNHPEDIYQNQWLNKKKNH